MFRPLPHIQSNQPGFSMAENFRFSDFIPRVYNYCTTKNGMRHGTIMPARAFCSDGSQGYPTMLMAKHFGTFPFDYGQIGGTFDFNRSPAFITHGKDLVVVQATHVGYDPVAQTYGTYPRHRTALEPENVVHTANCGHVAGVTKPYVKAYQSAARHTLIGKCSKTGDFLVYFRNFFVAECSARFTNRVVFDTNRMLKKTNEDGTIANFVKNDPVARTFRASDAFSKHLSQFPRFNDASDTNLIPLDDALTCDWFEFEKTNDSAAPLYEQNLKDIMQWVVTSPEPMLAAAQGCVQAEYHRFLSEVYFAKEMFDNRNFFYIAGLIVDVAPGPEQLKGDDAFFPRTLFVPWAAYSQKVDGSKETWDQERVFKELGAVSNSNDKSMVLDDEMVKLKELPPIDLHNGFFKKSNSKL